MHIAFIGLPLLGHINPTLEVVRELVRRGHRVTYPTTAQRHALIAETAAEVVTIETTFAGDTDQVKLPGRAEWMTHMRLAMLDEAAVVLPQLLAHFDADPPDLVVYDRAALAGKMLAALLKIKTIQLVPSFAANAHWAVTQKFAPVDPHTPTGELLETRLIAFLTSHGLTRKDLPVAQRQIIFLPKAFQYEGDTFDETFAFVGPCLRQSANSWTPPADGRQIMLISMGSIFNDTDIYRLCLRAFAASPWHVVMAIGDRIDIGELDPIPPNFEIMPFVPQLEVLAHASVFVGHAGMGGIMESLHFGVPSVLLPQTPEQEANAFRVGELGLGVVLEPMALSESALQTAVEKAATDPLIKERHTWMQREIRKGSGPHGAADAITAVVNSHQSG